MNPLEQIQKEYPHLTKSEQVFADYILKNPLEVIRYPLTTIAENSHSSNTAIIRLCQKLGYKGFSEFKFSLSRHALSDPDPAAADGDQASAIIGKYISYLGRMNVELDRQSVEQMAGLIVSCRRLAIMGYNRTGFSASQFSYRLSKLGIANHLVTDQVIMKDYMEILKEEDACALFSISTDGYEDIAKRLKEQGCPLLLITMNPNTPIRKYTHTTICLPRISYSTKTSFLDDQTLFFVFIEVLLGEIAQQAGGEGGSM